MRARTQFSNQIAFASQFSNDKKTTPFRQALALLAMIALLAGVVGLSSCAGLTSAANSTGNPGNSGPGALSASATNLSFGDVAVGSSAIQSVTVTNTGATAVDVSQAMISGNAYSVVGGNTSPSIPPGLSAKWQLQFAPVSTGAAAGTLTVMSNASNSTLSITLAGTGTQANLTISPAVVSFGNVTVGQSSTQSVKLTNTGNGDLTMTSAQISGAGFSMNGLATPMTMSAGQSASFNVQFAPRAAGGVSGGITFMDNATGSQQTLTLSANGVAANAALLANPGSVAFGNVTVGSNASQTITLSNSGNTSVSISQASVSGSGFSMSGIATPMTIAAGASTSFTAKFAPGTTGNTTGTIQVASSASDSTLTIALNGTGTQGQLSASPSSVNFGSVQVGASGSVSITLTNTGTASVTVSAASTSGTGFSMTGLAAQTTINPGTGATFTANFAPTAPGNDSGSISITSNAPGSPLTIALSGTATQGQLSATPASVSFGSVVTGNANSQTISLKNNGTASVTISQATVSGTGFNMSGLAIPATIAAGGGATFSVMFDPTSAGNDSGSILLVNNGPTSPMSIPLSGTGVAATESLSVSPATLSFGSVDDGTGTSQTVTLTNNGNSNVTISSVGVTGTGFSVSGVGAGLVLTPNQTATLSVTFDPTSGGAVTGTVSIVSNATNSPASVSVSGTGVQAHTVALSWTASTSTDVVSYNVYRGASAGSLSKIMSGVNGTTYTDATVQSGQNITYFYAVTAVDSNGIESDDSNQATATVQ